VTLLRQALAALAAPEGRRHVIPLVLLLTLIGCGKKGNPLPPVRPLPGAIIDAIATRYDDRVEIRATVPAQNRDRSFPPVVERLELYATTLPASAQPPADDALLAAKNLVQEIEVARPKDGVAPASSPQRPAPGQPAVFVDRTVAPLVGKADAPTRHYLVVAATGRNRRGTPAAVAVPLGRTVPAPTGVAVAYDDRLLRITWTAGPAGRAYQVEEVVRGAAGSDAPKTLTASPTTVAQFTTPVEMGRERCFAVRSVEVGKNTVIVGAVSAPVCETPMDTFAPAAPERVTAIASPGGIDLSWTGAEAADLAGYVVLRGEGAGGTLQALMTSPIARTQYRDTQARPGVTYIYVVVALDKTGNASPQSNQVQVTAR
jgi:hypothetical protein